MAYPFLPALTFRDVRTKLKQHHDCTFAEITHSSNPDGEPTTIITNSTANVAVTLRDDERLTWSQVRNICDRLGIARSEFGLSAEN